jgi:hypothetical protein
MQVIWRARVEMVVEIALEPMTSLKFAELLGSVNSMIQSVRISNLEKLRSWGHSRE